MSEPAIFVLIRDGDRRYYQDPFAHMFLFRELLWGPDALERWLCEGEEIDRWTEEAIGGAVVDFDRRILVWHGESGMLSIPKVRSLYDTLLNTAWPGFDVRFAAGSTQDLAEAAGEHSEQEDDEVPDRFETVQEAAGFDEDELPGDRLIEGRVSDDTLGSDEEAAETYENDMEDIFDEDDERAWITIVDEEGAVRHRNLQEVSQDLITADPDVVTNLLRLPPGDMPSESVVNGGIWIDIPRREVGVWGGPEILRDLDQMKNAWDGFRVRWAEDGYAEQCAVSGPNGIPMSNAEALGKLMPTILSNKRFDIGAVFNAVGGQIKKTAVRATGCFVGVLCTPVLLFGAISGKWQASFITVGIVIAFFMLAFKLTERRLKKKFALNEIANNLDQSGERAPVAGPMDPQSRRAAMEELLAKAGFPSLSEIEPHFASDSIEDLL